MRERPILMSAPMVRAILAGTKTQTRRAISVYSHHSYERAECLDGVWRLKAGALNGQYTVGRCRYGQPGQKLWVRETWMDLQGTGVEHRDVDGKLQRYAYGADTPPGSYGDEARKDYGLKWRPSIHMPRWASRITLRITDVRVERLQDISEADARAEGAPSADLASGRECIFPHQGTHRWGFQLLWESINGLESWRANPWVWVLSFEREEPAR